MKIGLELDLISLLVNVSCELEQKLPDMTSSGLDEWFWAMFEPTWTWPNFTFGQLFMWIGANDGQIIITSNGLDESNVWTDFNFI